MIIDVLKLEILFEIYLITNSQSQFKMLASNKTDPYEVILESLDCDRYNRIATLIAGLA